MVLGPSTSSGRQLRRLVGVQPARFWAGSATAAATDEESDERSKLNSLLSATGDGMADFHRSPHSHATNLARAGVAPNLAMDLMRHIDVNPTMRLDSHTVVAERAKALRALPDLSRTASTAARRTGIDTWPIDNANR